MAFGAELTYKDIPTEGIRSLVPLDFEAAQQFGYRIKLLAIAKSRREGGEERLEVRVHPTLIPASSLLAKVDGAMNALAVHGNAVGRTLFYGAGAGELPTASAVVADLMEIAREIRRGSAGRVAPLSYLPESLRKKPLVPLGDLHGRAYLCFTAEDRPGVLGQIATGLGEHGIGIESLIQQRVPAQAGAVPIVVLTHPAREGSLRRALERIDALPGVRARTRLLRIEEDL
jgi:homoserine dehydrogenase